MLLSFKNPEVIILLIDRSTGAHHFERIRNVDRVLDSASTLEVCYGRDKYIVNKSVVREWRVQEGEY